jgi:hypothetical protein
VSLPIDYPPGFKRLQFATGVLLVAMVAACMTMAWFYAVAGSSPAAHTGRVITIWTSYFLMATLIGCLGVATVWARRLSRRYAKGGNGAPEN